MGRYYFVLIVATSLLTLYAASSLVIRGRHGASIEQAAMNILSSNRFVGHPHLVAADTTESVSAKRSLPAVR